MQSSLHHEHVDKKKKKEKEDEIALYFEYEQAPRINSQLNIFSSNVHRFFF